MRHLDNIDLRLLRIFVVLAYALEPLGAPAAFALAIVVCLASSELLRRVTP